MVVKPSNCNPYPRIWALTRCMDLIIKIALSLCLLIIMSLNTWRLCPPCLPCSPILCLPSNILHVPHFMSHIPLTPFHVPHSISSISSILWPIPWVRHPPCPPFHVPHSIFHAFSLPHPCIPTPVLWCHNVTEAPLKSQYHKQRHRASLGDATGASLVVGHPRSHILIPHPDPRS